MINKKNIVKLVGAKRLTVLGALLFLLALDGGVYFAILTPMKERAESDLSRATGSVSSYRSKINNIQKDIDFLNENIPVYENILKQGLFDDQDRFRVVDVVNSLSTNAEVSKFSYNIGNREIIKSPDADKMGYAVIKRSIALTNIDAVIDVDVFSFFQHISYIFPKYVHIKGFTLKKNKDVTMDNLQKIANDENDNMVSASINFDWVTLTKKENVMSKEEIEAQKNAGKGGRRR